MDRRALLTAIASCLVAAGILVACGDEETAVEVDTTPIVGMMEIPISRSNQGTAPSNAARIEISPTELRLDHQKVLDLERGRPAESEVSEHRITKLRERIQAGAARQRVALRVHANVPYVTLVDTLNTLWSANLREVFVSVRTPGAEPRDAWMPLGNWRVVPAPGPEDTIGFEGRAPRWDDFVEQWRAVYDACRAGRYIDCDGPYATTAEGGELAMELWTRGQGMKVTFTRVAAPEDGAERGGGGPSLIEGIGAPAPRQPEPGEREPEPPATTGVFTVRHQEATMESESALSNLVAPVCADVTCQVTVVTDATTPTMRVISMIGGAFPNGFNAPQLVFVIPVERPRR